MKVLWLLTVLAVAVSAVPEDETRINGENGWYVPQFDGTFQWVDKDVAEKELEQMQAKEGRLSLNAVNFYLYTKSNPTKGEQITDSAKSIQSSRFNPANPTRFVIHGWNGSYKDGMNGQICKAWFTHGDVNCIAVNWSRAKSIEYASSVAAVPGAGTKVGEMVNYLVKNHGMRLDETEIIGHSLGAHVSGYAGKAVNPGQVRVIVGLDPALPLFSYDKPNKRLSSTDAAYVESIQTNGGNLGFLKPIGAGAFYPNGGKAQPGCGTDISCSHGRSVSYYIESVEIDDFPSMRCSNYENAVAKNCGSTYSSVRMGAVTNAYMVDGDFYVPVKSTYPYGMGS